MQLKGWMVNWCLRWMRKGTNLCMINEYSKITWLLYHLVILIKCVCNHVWRKNKPFELIHSLHSFDGQQHWNQSNNDLFQLTIHNYVHEHVFALHHTHSKIPFLWSHWEKHQIAFCPVYMLEYPSVFASDIALQPYKVFPPSHLTTNIRISRIYNQRHKHGSRQQGRRSQTNVTCGIMLLSSLNQSLHNSFEMLLFFLEKSIFFFSSAMSCERCFHDDD